MPPPAASRPSCAGSRAPPRPTGPAAASTCSAQRSRTPPRPPSGLSTPRAAPPPPPSPPPRPSPPAPADGVVAAPQNETSIALASIEFDGYPSFVARATGSDENDVYLMLCFDDVKIVHATLHRSVRRAIEMITHENIARVIAATDRALKR